MGPFLSSSRPAVVVDSCLPTPYRLVVTTTTHLVSLCSVLADDHFGGHGAARYHVTWIGNIFHDPSVDQTCLGEYSAQYNLC